MTPPLPPAICVLGMGLIGGSLLRATGERLSVSGWSPSEGTRAAATAGGFLAHAELEEALAWAVRYDALVVLAAPLTAFDTLLRKITRYAPEVLLTDVGSVKSGVAQQVSAIVPRARYIGGHPMAGTAESGFAAADARLFADAAWVTCLDDGSRMETWDLVAGLALAVGSRVVPCTAIDHDLAVARVSHLPHLLALALAQVAELGGPLALSLAAGSFTDGTRVAGTRPELLRAMLESNREPLVDAADDALGILGVARASLASTGSLERISTGGHAAREGYNHRNDGLTEFELVDPTAADLIAIGAAGGHLTELTRTDTGRTVRGLSHPA
ncbi:prephenate dehydrogenase [Nakamurella lactea]|uniref:prephenate dehydrogenase n=1 Tax=Nakamurella lactea TaxID=459515 RepID=UPI000414E813|nr:prephenate dehydrogenase [Nakamurella lactea]